MERTEAPPSIADSFLRTEFGAKCTAVVLEARGLPRPRGREIARVTRYPIGQDMCSVPGVVAPTY